MPESVMTVGHTGTRVVTYHYKHKFLNSTIRMVKASRKIGYSLPLFVNDYSDYLQVFNFM